MLTFTSQRQIYGHRLAGELEAGLKWWPVGVGVQFIVISVGGGKGSLVPQSRAALQHHLLDAVERCNSINDISLHLNVLRCHWCSAERVPGDLLRFEAGLRLDLGLKVFCISATISLYLI